MSDAKTGMPQLPNGEHWKVSFYKNIVGTLGVKVKRKKGLRTLGWSVAMLTDGWGTDMTPEEYPDKIAQVARRVMYQIAENTSQKAEVRKLKGSYPPKKLN